MLMKLTPNGTKTWEDIKDAITPRRQLLKRRNKNDQPFLLTDLNDDQAQKLIADGFDVQLASQEEQMMALGIAT